jgi:Co/Zn/Cd efflux system component
MDSCCEHKEHELAGLRARHGKVLQLALAINAAMFCIEVAFGFYAHSTAVLADALDMFGDATIYALSLHVLSRGTLWRARALLAKGATMALFGAAVIGEAAAKLADHGAPHASMMSLAGVLALFANATCFGLLYRHRGDDVNMRSTWLCSRNDMIANCGVLLASAGVALTRTSWPDLIVGLAIASLFLHSAISVIRDGLGELRSAAASSGGR